MRSARLAAALLLTPAAALADSSCSASNADNPPQTCSVTCPTPASALCNNGPGTVRPFCACVGAVTFPTLPTQTTTPPLGTTTR